MQTSTPPMQARRSFLTAQWRNLILANYPVPEELLRPLLPPGCELDCRDGQYWASLVGFQFLHTKLLGVAWPRFTNFPEWNLRFYVTHNGERGVCFVRELVPSWLVATTAHVFYNEPYRSVRMSMDVKDTPDKITASYTVKWGGRVHSMHATGAKPPVRPGPDSTEHWFKEHSWGFGTSRRRQLVRFEVYHPEWDVYPMIDFEMNVDWATLYGPEWGAMQQVAPSSVVFAVGSDVSVYPKG